jgi:hypothetical protein
MTDDNPKYFKKNLDAPKRTDNLSAPNLKENINAPRQLNGNQDVSPLGTNASGTPVSSKPKKN